MCFPYDLAIVLLSIYPRKIKIKFPQKPVYEIIAKNKFFFKKGKNPKDKEQIYGKCNGA